MITSTVKNTVPLNSKKMPSCVSNADINRAGWSGIFYVRTLLIALALL
jgi:hypothetical protein